MKLYVYLNYGGNCEQAFRFYEQHFGAKMTETTRHGDVPNPNLPDGWGNAVLHARIDIGGTVVMGGDIPGDRFRPLRSAYLTLRLDSHDEAERTSAWLASGVEMLSEMKSAFI